MQRRTNMALKNRFEFIILFSAIMCNPNGDPNFNNAPRQDEETGNGIMTDVCIKRWLRNYVAYAYMGKDGMEIVMKDGTSINKHIAEAVFSANKIASAESLPKNSKGKRVNPKPEESARYLCDRYWDMRAFGGVMSTGLNAGQIRGAVQLEMPVSIDPVQVSNLSITRMCYAETSGDLNTIEDYEKEEAGRSSDMKRTMGEKQIVYYGLYALRGTISAAFAEKTGFSEKDLNVLCEALIQMFSHNVSSSKAGMHLETPVILFKHVGTQDETNAEEKAREAKLGCVPAQKLFKLLEVHKKDGVEYPRSTNDYDICFNLSALPDGVEVGFKEMPFEDFVWGEDIRKREYDIEVK